MKQYEMPYSFLFTDEEMTDLWSYYRRIHQIIQCLHDRCIFNNVNDSDVLL